MVVEHVDVLIVGAGLSGIGAGYHLQTRCPNRRYAILEAREASGGTWDLFRYPGVRSDSDMHTLGYGFRPWTDSKTIADGSDVLRYIRETASSFGIDRHIRYQHRVCAARWSSADARWIVDVECGPERQPRRLSCHFLYLCCGYYRYDAGHTPDYPDRARYRGQFVHPQQWPETLDVTGRRVVVIGSGATAVTLVPALARHAAQVTMLQRSPSYVVALPDRDRLADALRRWLPARAAHGITRWKNVLSGMLFFQLCRRAPTLVRNLVIRGVRKALGPAYHVEQDFAPDYRPWDQRMCLAPNGDLFKAIRSGRAQVVTDHIDTFTESGIRLRSGRELQADVIVSATGLDMQLLGGLRVEVDGQVVDLSKTLSYKGMMCSDVPNLAFALGYTNASWTLRCDLTAEYVCRLLNHMDLRGWWQCVPRQRDGRLETRPLIDFSSGYVLRAIDRFPRQGHRAPWRLNQNYLLDLLSLRFGALEDGVMEFTAPASQPEIGQVAAARETLSGSGTH